jgi:hypothetical protein
MIGIKPILASKVVDELMQGTLKAMELAERSLLLVIIRFRKMGRKF